MIEEFPALTGAAQSDVMSLGGVKQSGPEESK